MNNIGYPTLQHRKYIETIYNWCLDNKFSMILKGSLAKGTAGKFSDIDLLISGEITDEQVDELITVYDKPVMANFTVNPKDILILVYANGISVDLDIRESVSQEDLIDSKILIKNESNFILCNTPINRKKVNSKYMPNRQEWYKVLRLIHKAAIKYLCNKTNSANVLLDEIKESLSTIEISNLEFKENFQYDIKLIFQGICDNYEVDDGIKVLFEQLFIEFNEISKL